MDELYRYKINDIPGQLNPNTEFGQFLNLVVQEPVLKTFVEFGTWNGMGSTKSIMDGLVKRKDDSIFVSYEANQERHLVAKKLWENIDKCSVDLRLVYGKVSEEIYTLDYVQQHKRFHQDMEMWYKLEVQQTKSAPVIHDVLPDTIDFVLFDGGEFCTIGDWNFMERYNPKVVALDDIDSFKTCDIYERLEEDSRWAIIAKGGHHDKVSKYTWASFVRV